MKIGYKDKELTGQIWPPSRHGCRLKTTLY